ncbi:VTT domain-containing protein [Myxococcota bacterium]|nr:VTT domain-containing protein [Myxococcota bacterium]MBU1534476.1 VTT domain-containing protein [Myxococcota bacterium]
MEQVEAGEAPVQKKKRFARTRRLIRKLIIWAVIIGVIYGLFVLFKDDIIGLLQKNRYTWTTYVHISAQISQKTLLGLFYAGFFGSLFFILIPLEAVFFYYLALPYNGILVLIIMLISSVLGLGLDYIMGRLVGESVLLRFKGTQFEKYKRAMESYGGLIVFVSNIIPFLPVQIISVAVGATRFGLKRFMVYTFISRGVYLVMLWYTADFFKTYLLPYL